MVQQSIKNYLFFSLSLSCLPQRYYADVILLGLLGGARRGRALGGNGWGEFLPLAHPHCAETVMYSVQDVPALILKTIPPAIEQRRQLDEVARFFQV